MGPLDVNRNGQLFGAGLYFADMISKSIQYTHDYVPFHMFRVRNNNSFDSEPEVE